MNVLELASTLIHFPTVSPEGNEEECVKFLRDYFESPTFADCETEIHKFQPRRANLIVRFARDKPAGLLLSGHVDVVPPGDLTNWKSPPFEGRVLDGKLYGRGSADMKGGLAAMIKALENLKELEEEKKGIIFVATAGEESGFTGLEAMMREEKLSRSDARFCIIGEPTNLQMVRAHRGVTRFEITLNGKSSHASKPEMGINAIEASAEFISKLGDLREELDADRDKLLGSTSLAVTTIQGGTGENVVPDVVKIVVDSRRIPIHDSSKLLDSLNAIVVQLKERNLIVDGNVRIKLDHAPLYTSPDDYLVLTAEKTIGSKSGSCSFGTEGSLYQHDLGLPTIIFGPGDVGQAHTIDEFVQVNQLEQAATMYKKMIRQICF